MQIYARFSIAVLTASVTSACAVSSDPVEGRIDDAQGEVTGTADEALTSPVTGARIVARTPSARVLELFDASGRVVASYYPGFFTARQSVPDVAGNTGGEIAQKNRGTYFLAATMNPRTGVVGVAVRSFIYAEVSFEMVYLLNTQSRAFRSDPYASSAATLLPFDGRSADGRMLGADDVTRPFLDIVAGGLAYDSAGRLTVRTSDASGANGTIVYNPSLTVASCKFVGGEGRRCPR